MAVGVLFLLWTFQVLGMTAKVTGACVGTFFMNMLTWCLPCFTAAF